MNVLNALRKIRGCEGEAAAMVVLEFYVKQQVEVELAKERDVNIDRQIKLLDITAALVKCHESFRMSEHGGVAEQQLRHDLEKILTMPYDG